MTARRQKGFSIVPALFLLVVLSGLGVVIVRMNVLQQQTVVLTMQSARALNAARSGIEWAAYEATRNGGCGNNILILGEAGLAGFTVQTRCSETSHVEGGLTVTVFRLEAFASAGQFGQPDYVSRRIFATVADES